MKVLRSNYQVSLRSRDLSVLSVPISVYAVSQLCHHVKYLGDGKLRTYTFRKVVGGDREFPACETGLFLRYLFVLCTG